MSGINFGKIGKYLLLGGGPFLSRLAILLQKKNLSFSVVTGERFLSEVIDGQGKTFENFLKESHIEHWLTDDINHNERALKLVQDGAVGLSVAAPWIFKKELIEQFQGRLINFHFTRLPLYRGGASFSWQILSGDRRGGWTIHQVDGGIDTGRILKQRDFIFPEDCVVPADYYRICEAGFLPLIEEFLAELDAGKYLALQEQDEKSSIYFPRLSTVEQGFINWDWSAQEIDSFIKAFDDPYSGASTFLNGERVFLKKSRIETRDGQFHPFQAGFVYRKHGGEMFIAARGGGVAVGDIPAVKVGDRLTTPREILEKATIFKAVYTPKGLKKHDQ